MYYFVADVHLRADGGGNNKIDHSVSTEDRFVAWLTSIEADAKAIFLCGDIFDFWFEYERVVPMGFVAVFAKLKQLSRSGVRVVFMVGNHDMWMGDYLNRECGVEIYYAPTHFELDGQRVHVAHGDNLNVRGDLKLKLMNWLFRSPNIRMLFKWLVHPDLAMRFGLWWSNQSRLKHREYDERGVAALMEYAEQRQKLIPSDCYIYGHIHVAEELRLKDSDVPVIFVNDWSKNPHYMVIDQSGVPQLRKVLE